MTKERGHRDVEWWRHALPSVQVEHAGEIMEHLDLVSTATTGTRTTFWEYIVLRQLRADRDGPHIPLGTEVDVRHYGTLGERATVAAFFDGGTVEVRVEKDKNRSPEVVAAHGLMTMLRQNKVPNRPRRGMRIGGSNRWIDGAIATNPGL